MQYSNTSDLNNYYNYEYNDDDTIGDIRLSLNQSEVHKKPDVTKKKRIVGVNKQGKPIMYDNRNTLEYINADNDLQDVKDDIDLESIRSEKQQLTSLTELTPSLSEGSFSSDEEGGEDDGYHHTNRGDTSNVSSNISSAESIDRNNDEEGQKKGIPSSKDTTSCLKAKKERRRLSLNLNIDEAIINKVLGKSIQRSKRLKRSESLKKMFNNKCWKQVLVTLFVIFGIRLFQFYKLFICDRFYMLRKPG